MTTAGTHLPPSPPGAAPPGCTDHKNDHLTRLNKVEGQVRGITRMVGEDRYCLDLLTPISAVTRALQEVAVGLLDDHIRHCAHDAVRTDDAAGEAELDELVLSLRRTLRL
ncbi:metal-sensitive transcriptional regulator [Streptomyces sp. NEAU-W12]|uniref:metal-sensitive transcriptional regulator n=1 Tax=Streptomyces sp. NEAU-W12 TaxID=2994668 RepID=UPI00224B59E6|nr:metal-sensitive transcriptional regulator [Streptomyces sp. NEAU-W12]MCX2926983.1 metal-sensitive transcriptional regulator [Streptomyces sp. NEAU-W12]